MPSQSINTAQNKLLEVVASLIRRHLKEIKEC